MRKDKIDEYGIPYDSKIRTKHGTIYKVTRSRIDQDLEIRLNFEPYATIGCKVCHGTAKKGWLEYLGGERYGAYEICECVMKNIRKIKEGEEVVN